jgi:hypothetical protein
MSHQTLHISRRYGGLFLVLFHLVRNEPSEREKIVVCSASWNKVSCPQTVTFDNSDHTTDTELKTIHVVFVLSWIAAVDLWIRRTGNSYVTNWWTNVEGRSNTEIWMIILDDWQVSILRSSSDAAWSENCTCNTQGMTLPPSSLGLSPSHKERTSSVQTILPTL